MPFVTFMGAPRSDEAEPSPGGGYAVIGAPFGRIIVNLVGVILAAGPSGSGAGTGR